VPSREPFYADLHIHSKYSRACSRDCDLEHLTWWARRKGISLVGTGDFTHPAWNEHLHEMLAPAEPGLYRLRGDVQRDVDRTLPPSCDGDVRFMLSVEISTIYKRDDRTRKVHHLVYLPDLDAVSRFNKALGRIGNLGADGRPILGLDSRDLLEITLNASPDGYLVPAHIWTPWFAALGSKSGFDAIADCYADLADHVFAVETGLSSDPPMNWRVSSLDRYTLVSNSDAHSPPALGREAHSYDCALDYFAIREALRTGDGYRGSLEFFPEEGKYHADGHRACGVRFSPAETEAANGRCPECGKPLTVGVLTRIEALADRPDGARPEGAAGYRNLVPLPEMVGEIRGVGPKSKQVVGEVANLVAKLGPELRILEDVPVEDIAAAGAPMLAEAVTRLRRGEVIRQPGYDGEYGVIRLFDPSELAEPALFAVAAPEPIAMERGAVGAPARQDTAVPTPEPVPEPAADGLLGGLDPDQRAAAGITEGPLLIVAGPGTGKTRTLTHRLAHLVAEQGADPQRCLAITFTRRAAEEMRERIAALVPGQAADIMVATFHALGLAILREHHDRAGLTRGFQVAGDADRLALLSEVTGSEADARRARAALSRTAAELPADLADVRERYVKALRAKDLVDVDELVTLPVALLDADLELVARYRERFGWVCVDEYQDVDEAQYRLLRLLVPADGNLCAIGDPDQAIYAFRGADVGFFLQFRRDYPGAHTVQLTRNYRSAAPIVTAALHAIRPSTLVPDRVLSTMRRSSEAPRVGVHRAQNEQGEASFVARTIDELIGGSSFHSLDSGRVDGRRHHGHATSFADIAVLYRTDVQAGAVVDALARAGVPMQKRSHDRLDARSGVRALARELRFAGPGGGPVLTRLKRAAHAIAERAPGGAAPGGPTLDARGVEAWSAVDLLAPLAERCGDDVTRFLAEVALGAEVDTLDPRADAVSLLTLHAAKGLEFPVVFLVGCEAGLLPFSWPGSAADDAQVAEERRLFFVGITRARDRLFLSHAAERTRHGATRAAGPSPFLAPVEGLLERLNADTKPRPTRPQQMRLL